MTRHRARRIYAVPVLSLLFFFKQKTAYEITYVDWSSDVCSSDLARRISGWRSACTTSPGAWCARSRAICRRRGGIRSPGMAATLRVHRSVRACTSSTCGSASGRDSFESRSSSSRRRVVVAGPSLAALVVRGRRGFGFSGLSALGLVLRLGRERTTGCELERATREAQQQRRESPARARQVEAEERIHGDSSWTDECHARGGEPQHHRVLVATLYHEKTLLQVHAHDRDGHDTHEHRGRQRGHRAEREQSPAARLGEPGEEGAPAAGNEAQSFHVSGHGVDAAAAEPAEELLGAMCRQRQPHHHAQKQESDAHTITSGKNPLPRARPPGPRDIEGGSRAATSRPLVAIH